MQFHIRRLTEEDLPKVEDMASKKFDATNTSAIIFQDVEAKQVFRHFVLPDSVAGNQRFLSFGCFDADGNLYGVLGLRCIEERPAWVLSFIVTSTDCSISSGLVIIKSLMKYAVKVQEERGYFQWFVCSKADKFSAWQKLFLPLRERYHHYVYARVPAHELPNWLSTLELVGNKIYPYDINISMYMLKSMCTNPEDRTDISETDIEFL